MATLINFVAMKRRETEGAPEDRSEVGGRIYMLCVLDELPLGIQALYDEDLSFVKNILELSDSLRTVRTGLLTN
jgi:hypothetical protein